MVKKLLIAIPAFNEETTLKDVISKIPKKLTQVKRRDILVVDDGSVDKTGKIAVSSGAIVVKHVINCGLGAAIGSAFSFAKNNNYDLLVTLDADGQHDPQNISDLLRPIISGKADVVIGSRLKNSRNMPVDRLIINVLANFFTYLISGVITSDSQSGFRAFSKKAIGKINVITQRMEVSSEIFREIHQNKLRYKEVSIKPVYTDYSLNKGQSSFNAPFVIYKLLIRLARR